MRSNFAADWAFGTRGAIENVVRQSFPMHLRQWPLMQAFDFEAYAIDERYACIVLRDKLAGIPSGPGDLKPFPYAGYPALPPSVAEVETWQFYLRSKFGLRHEDAVVTFPIHDSGKRAPDDFALFSAQDQHFWHTQIFHIVAQYKTYLDTFQKAAPPQSVNIIYNVSGQNTRVNINSFDSSTNTYSESSDLFLQLRGAATSIDDSEKRKTIESSIKTMEESRGTPSFASAYKDFISVAADHMTVFAPFLPALSAFLS